MGWCAEFARDVSSKHLAVSLERTGTILQEPVYPRRPEFLWDVSRRLAIRSARAVFDSFLWRACIWVMAAEGRSLWTGRRHRTTCDRTRSHDSYSAPSKDDSGQKSPDRWR